MTLHWSSRFVGVPWRDHGRDRAGLDCFGLVKLVLAVRCGVLLPSYADAYADVGERAEIGAIMAGDAARWPWQPVPNGQERELDVALFRRGALAAHVGVVLQPGRMLHIEEGCASCVAAYDSGKWRPRLLGVYRYAALS